MLKCNMMFKLICKDNINHIDNKIINDLTNNIDNKDFDIKTSNINDNVVINNHTNIDNEIFANMIINEVKDIDINVISEKVLKKLANTGLNIECDIIDNKLHINILKSNTYSIASLENPFICDKTIGDKIIGCPTFQKLKNNIFSKHLLDKYLPNLIYEYYEKYNEILYPKHTINIGGKYIELYAIPYRISGIGYYDIMGQVSPKELEDINVFLYKPNILTPILTMLGMNNNMLQDKSTHTKTIELLNRYLAQEGYTGSIIAMNIYIDPKQKVPSVFIKFILNSEQKLITNNIKVTGTDDKIDKIIENQLNDIKKNCNITKQLVNNIVKKYKLICSDFIYENIDAKKNRNLYIFLNYDNNQNIIKDIGIYYFYINNKTLFKIASNCGIIAGKYCPQHKIQTFANILYQLTGSQPNIQYTDNNGLILSIYAGHKHDFWEWSIDNVSTLLDFKLDSGLSVYAGSFNFHTIKKKALSLTIKPGIRVKSLNIFSDSYLYLGTSLYSIIKSKYIFESNIGLPINIQSLLKGSLKMAQNQSNIVKSLSESFEPSVNFTITKLIDNGNLKLYCNSNFHYDQNQQYNKYAALYDKEQKKLNNNYIINSQLNKDYSLVHTNINLIYEKELFDSNNINITSISSLSTKFNPQLLGFNGEYNLYGYIDKYPYYIATNLQAFSSYSLNNSKEMFDANNSIKCIGYDKSQYFFSKYALGFKMFGLKEIFNTQKYISQNIASLVVGVFINGYLLQNINFIPSNTTTSINCIGSIGFIIAIDIQGQLLYIAYYFSINNGFGFTIGSCNRIHVMAAKNMQRSMELLN